MRTHNIFQQFNKPIKLRWYKSGFMVLCLLAGFTFQSRAQTANLGKLLHQVEANAPALKAANANTKISDTNGTNARLRAYLSAILNQQTFSDSVAPPVIQPAEIQNSPFPIGTGEVNYYRL